MQTSYAACEALVRLQTIRSSQFVRYFLKETKTIFFPLQLKLTADSFAYGQFEPMDNSASYAGRSNRKITSANRPSVQSSRRDG